MYKQNKYSVPDYLVEKYVNAKITVNRINVYFSNNLAASHEKSYKNQTWSMNIEHYRNTLLKKPGAIKNSLAFSQLNTKLQSIFNKHFLNNPKEFIELLDIVSEYGFEKIKKKSKEQLLKYDDLFKTQDIQQEVIAI